MRLTHPAVARRPGGPAARRGRQWAGPRHAERDARNTGQGGSLPPPAALCAPQRSRQEGGASRGEHSSPLEEKTYLTGRAGDMGPMEVARRSSARAKASTASGATGGPTGMRAGSSARRT